MFYIKMILVYPFLWISLYSCSEKTKIKKDCIAWCKWKKLPYSIINIVKLFIEFKEFRFVIYYRIGFLRYLIQWILKPTVNLYITTTRKDIEGGLMIQHGFATIISAKHIGKNCKIYQQVTIGYNHNLEAPIIGDNVEVCCGAKIIGGVTIGNNVLIGANAVVVKDIPDNCIVAGIPAKIIGHLPSEQDIFSRVK